MSDPKPGGNLAVSRDEDLRQAIELLFFAYRDFTARADAILAKQGFGRAHHRVIYFVGRHPGITVSALLDILGITKQSLSRVLSQLVRESYIMQKKGAEDGRQRLLHLTEKGRELERLLTTEQRARIAAAYRAAGTAAVEGFRKVMLGIMDDDARRRFKIPGR
ncbi:MAG: MarR family transcriptional regulator [Rhodospirillaceae bacterium]|nr:MarR family transcriptional regulator [Rhodospirillaceae bacterium]